MTDKPQKLKIDLSFLDNDNKKDISKEKQSNTFIEDGKYHPWTCQYCNEEFKTKSEADEHEKICELNTENKKIKTVENKNINKELEKDDKRFKKIYNAGTSAVALGWFSLVVNIILLFIDFSSNGGSGILVFNLIYISIVSYLFIKYGKIIKKVNGVTIKDINVLLWTCGGILVVSLLGGGGIGIILLLEIFYLLGAKSVIKKSNILKTQ